MPIVAEFGRDVEEYIELGKEHNCQRPENCPTCQAVGQMISHGYYRRKPKDLDKGWVLWVKRWKCKVCGHTFGAVPSFLLFYRHYLLGIIQHAVVGRFEMGYTWTQMAEQVSDSGTPAIRTMQRWCGELTEQAMGWTEAIEKTLAEQDSGSEWLDPQGEAGQKSIPGQALLGASLHFLAWAKGRWREVEAYVLNDRLRWLWYWGNGRWRFSRLV